MQHRIILIALFFASGAGSLIYQVVWQRVLTQEIGIDAVSAALVVATFMLGLGIGAALGGLLTRISWSPLKTLAAIELIVAMCGFASIASLRSFNAHVVPSDSLAIQIAMNGLLLILPIIAMGATGPLMVSAWERTVGQSESIGYAYGANVLGAAFGISIGGFYLIGTMGLVTTTAIVALVDVVLATLFLVLSRNSSSAPNHPPAIPPTREDRSSNFSRSGLWAASLLVGFCALAYEISYFRIFTTIFGFSAYVFPALIFAYLANMAAGTWIADRHYRPERAPTLLAMFATLGIVLTIPAVLFLPFLEAVTRQDAYVMDPSLTGANAWLQIARCLAISTLLMLPVAAISAIFPILVRENASLTTSPSERAFANIYFVQTLGNTAGSVIAAFVLFPLIGVLGTLGVAGAILGITAACLSWRSTRVRFQKLAISGTLVVVACWATFATIYDYPKSVKYYLTAASAASPVHTTESVHGMTMLYDRGKQPNESYAVMASGRFYVTGLVGPAANVSHFPAATEALAYAINPRIRTILFIGLGTAHEILTFKKLFPNAHITVVEINPDLVTIIRKFGHPDIASALDGTDLKITDGRRYVQSLPHEKTFDYIHIGVARATAPGSANIFSADFLAKAKSHLAPNGVVTFNGYPNVVKAALAAFGDVAVAAVSPDITVTVATREAGKISTAIETGEFSSNFADAVGRQNGQGDSLFVDGGAFAGYREKGWLVNRKGIDLILSDIKASTDDLLATEYYLNQRTSLLPARRLNSIPTDLRGWGSIDLAQPFPFPLANKHEIERTTLVDLTSSQTELLSRSSRTDAVVVAPDRHFRLSFDALARTSNAATKSWQWELNTAKVKLRQSPNTAYLLEITAQKSGRGRWGAKVYCIQDGKLHATRLEETEDTGLRTLRAFISHEIDPSTCKFAMTFDETPGIGSSADLRIANIKLLELNASLISN